MELEAKERRRMFGNIGFIGQLYRHELIVPKILKWCIIHLLKNHSDSPVAAFLCQFNSFIIALSNDISFVALGFVLNFLSNSIFCF